MIDGAPQVHPFAGNPDHHLVEMPAVARAWTALPQLARDQGAEFQHPAPHRLIGDFEAALDEEILDIAVAQGKAKIQPNRMLDDRGRKPVATV